MRAHCTGARATRLASRFVLLVHDAHSRLFPPVWQTVVSNRFALFRAVCGASPCVALSASRVVDTDGVCHPSNGPARRRLSGFAGSSAVASWGRRTCKRDGECGCVQDRRREAGLTDTCTRKHVSDDSTSLIPNVPPIDVQVRLRYLVVRRLALSTLYATPPHLSLEQGASAFARLHV